MNLGGETVPLGKGSTGWEWVSAERGFRHASYPRSPALCWRWRLCFLPSILHVTCTSPPHPPPLPPITRSYHILRAAPFILSSSSFSFNSPLRPSGYNLQFPRGFHRRKRFLFRGTLTLTLPVIQSDRRFSFGGPVSCIPVLQQIQEVTSTDYIHLYKASTSVQLFSSMCYVLYVGLYSFVV